MSTLVAPTLPSASRGPTDSAPGRNHPRPRSEPPREGHRSTLAVLGGGIAGLLAGIDALLLLVLIVMLRGSTADDLVIRGVGHAGWSADSGVEVGIAPGGVAILLTGVVIGAVIARAISRGSERGRPLSGTA